MAKVGRPSRPAAPRRGVGPKRLLQQIIRDEGAGRRDRLTATSLLLVQQERGTPRPAGFHQRSGTGGRQGGWLVQ